MYDPNDMSRDDRHQAGAYLREQKRADFNQTILAGVGVLVGILLVLAQVPAIGLVVVAMGLIWLGYLYPTFGAALFAFALIVIVATGLGGSYEGGWR